MKNELNILIVEDEFITLDNLKETVEDLGYGIAGTAMKADNAIAILEEGKADFAILDINLKSNKDGIWIGEQIQKKYHIPFIYLTAFTDSETVKKAASTQPSSYLVKPFTQPSVFAAIEVAINAVSPLPFSGKELFPHQYIFIKEDKVYKKIYLTNIRYVEAFKNYLEINLTDGRHIIRSTMKDFIENLPAHHFLQTHRSFVVNKNFVESISPDSIILRSKTIPVTKAFRSQILEILEV